MLKLFNSFSSSKQDFVPFNENLVKIFICGPTVYDYTHLGHARIFLTYDLLSRYLNDKGLQTDVLVNLTDINQNVFNKAKENLTTYKDVAKFYTSAFVVDLQSLGIESITRLAYVSDYVSSIEKQVQKLIEKKVAYTAHGNVYLDVSRVHNYGQISKQTRAQLNMHRLDIGPGKKNQEDVMLWNCTDDFDFSWESDLGKGIPWWHMQDTAVAVENFGKNYDIHGGARELLYPHHEAHLAQYELLTGSEEPVRAWVHVGLVFSDGEKMSKSLGNVVWVKDLIKKYSSDLIRLYIFSKHYRDDMNFSEKDLLSQKPLLDLIRLTASRVSDTTHEDISILAHSFMESLDDDLDSPSALAKIEKICTEVKNGKSLSKIDFNRICKILGIHT
ncbi:Cysteinyl-tRNA synthetase [Candidatus Nitrosotalea sp. FS]|uniref:class I tRNA ligase family protein n=1 Tax=Candidatus Nitrosotalea sp. FS TaxID=2341021 RepID=UPI00140DAD59|nr:class I tRNA ligase family protein [Candidatus Nitrosotalea sp. FS]NHH97385.1 Cysteinyl-tRNA synthetase [Candidatus Nitrosotalea sp. FS]